ncbi:MAG TPA: hypothetical protein VGX68_06280 [Thermoanaerobaculia bacterium]|nr:hypothetical protein [Thermoanaerobaculia bacterium]
MIKQTINWTALPARSNGPIAAGTELRLSVFVAPRLWNDDPTVKVMPLSDFPDWLDWPAVIAPATFQVEFQGGPTLPATVESAAPRSDLWQALFKPATTVKPFAFEDLSGVEILSFPAATVHDTIKGVYQRAAIDPTYGGGADLPSREVLGNDPDLVDIAGEVRPPDPWVPPETDRGPQYVGGKEPEDEGEGEEGEKPGPLDGCLKGCSGCLLWPFLLLRRLIWKLFGVSIVPLPMMAGSAKKEAFDKLHAYVQPHSVTSVPLPTQPQIEEQYDFHQMISSLGDYPVLMRELGLVVDLVVTLDAALPANPGTVRIIPTAPLATPTSNFTPRTHYDLGVERFQARPRAGSDLSDGLLRLNEASRFRVMQIDLPGSGIKLRNTATNLHGMEQLKAWPANAPEAAGLPALQTAGISIARAEQVPELLRRIDHSYSLNRFLTTVDASPLAAYQGAGPQPAASDELFADDVVRGYRLDVLDDKSGVWRSLCRRLGNYDFLDGPISLADAEDEGFTQMGSTESRVALPKRALRVHESLFTWDGWSLVAPRPGRTILPDQTEGNSANAAVTQFKLETKFRAKPGSLPRLRFGWKYRVRARMVDLAGNSPFGPDDAAFADTQIQVTPEFQFTRFEPLAPPPLVLRAVPVEGESLERLVVRSAIQDAPADIANQTTERHVVPPKTSQLLAERHGVFDGVPGILKNQAAYDLASREAGSLTERLDLVTGTLEPIPGIVKDEDPVQKRIYWLQPNAQFEIAFLPDNFARGVLLLGLPGMAAPDDIIDGVNRIEFTGVWPDLEAFRLRLKGLQDGAAPAQPAWNAADRVLTAEVPQGVTLRVRYSSYFLQADLEKMGIWEWAQEANPIDLADLEKLAEDGRNWLLLPFRTLDLVHAVQQPLAIPNINPLSILPPKQLGATEVTLDGNVDIDAKSTGKIDLKAAWSDPFDDLAKPSFNAATDLVQKSMHVEEVFAPDAANDQLAISNVKHALGDTKYHRVTYTAIGTTRYRECFPPAVLANPEDLVRPTPAEVGTPPADAARFDLDVPNSARPDAMKPLYAVPAFAWKETVNAGIITKERRGGGLRLYMERPWFSSGAGELVGVVLRPGKYAPLTADWMTLRKFVSEWGMDPIWRAAETEPLTKNDFANSVKDQPNLTLEELSGLDVDVVGFEAQYDTDRNLWFCDIALKADSQYFPFVRLALARYQPISVPNAHLSRVVPSDFIQVLPHRTVVYDTTQANQVSIKVNGPAYFNPQHEQFASPLVIARVERRRFDTGDELGWEGMTTQVIPVDQQSVANTVWKGTVALPNPAPGPLRVLVLEAEIYATDPQAVNAVIAGLAGLRNDFFPEGHDPATGTAGRQNLGYRIAFADSIELP